MSIIGDAGSGAAAGSLFGPLGTGIGAGIGLLGGIFGQSGANAARRRQQQLEDQGLAAATGNYQGRSPFRDAALAALGRPGVDWNSIYDPSMYHENAVPYTESARTTGANADEKTAYASTQNVDRLAQVRDALNSFNASTAPDYEADQRSAVNHAAAAGGLGSGALNTSLGDLALTRSIKRQGLTDQLIQDATTGSINDRFRSLDASQREQALGTQADEASYNRNLAERNRGTALKEQSLSDRLRLADQNNQDRQSQMSQALGYGGFGFGNDPSNYLAMLAGRAGQSADSLGNAAAGSFSGLGQILAGLGRRPGAGSSAGIGNNSGGYPVYPE